MHRDFVRFSPVEVDFSPSTSGHPCRSRATWLLREFFPPLALPAARQAGMRPFRNSRGGIPLLFDGFKMRFLRRRTPLVPVDGPLTVVFSALRAKVASVANSVSIPQARRHEGDALIDAIAAGSARDVGVEIAEQSVMGVRYQDLTVWRPVRPQPGGARVRLRQHHAAPRRGGVRVREADRARARSRHAREQVKAPRRRHSAGHPPRARTRRACAAATSRRSPPRSASANGRRTSG